MPKRTKRANRLSFVSKKDYAALRNEGVCQQAIGYYQDVLKKHANTDAPANELFKMLFGETWYNEPFSKLIKVLKLATNKGTYVPHPYMTIDRADVMRMHELLRTLAARNDSTMMRICKRYYSAKTLSELEEKAGIAFKGRSSYYGYGTFDQHLVDLAKFAAYVKKYDKQDLKQLKKASSADQLIMLSNKAGDVSKYKGGCYGRDLRESMTESQLNELLKRSIKATLKCVFGTKAEKELGAIEENLINQQGWAYSRTTFSGCCANRVFDDAAKKTREVNKLYDMENIMEKLSLEQARPDDRPWRREQRVSGKIYTMLKHLLKEYENGTPLEIVQHVAQQQSGLICRENYNGRAWAPELSVKENI